ncbi:molecular chaperone HscC [Marinobacter confluentis]|uniref:Molecular chaperone HscC n=1 Tax=Marinobacter confluentis TaxID=1697557 RepID=A0A4Z1BNC0_9GAMM|nr:molecular chaperone HscC [Marinobacter confluentis]TGN38847.1 molecular chaperone HscC [Marinobacter confluentis]
MAVVGIDLGTTNSLVSVWQDGASRVIPNSLGELLTPSVVSVDDRDMVLVGRAAKDRLVSHPQLTASQFKRLMGTQEKVTLGRRTFSPEELSALVLKQLVADAENHLGETVDEAIISVPAYFNNNQRTATLHAAQLAGLHVERLINEPTAAALAYGIQEAEDERNFIVVDLGGGTLDVSILEKFDDLLEVHATSGDSFLGGEDFTFAMVGAVCEKLSMDMQALPPEERAHLYRLCDQAKKALGDQPAVEIAAKLGGAEHRVHFSREDFSQCSAELLERIRAPLERAVKDSGMNRSEFHDVILVGGASRMPLVKNFVVRLFGRIPSATIDPDLVVAMGAAVQAALKERNQALKDTVLTDVCPFSLGIETAQKSEQGHRGGFFAVLIPRNTVVPASRVDTFCTTGDYQTSLKIMVYQGEHRLVKNNVHIGELSVRVPRAPAGKEAADVRFTYNINGLLEVQVDVVSTGVRETLVIQNTSNNLGDAELTQLLENMQALKFHPREDSANIAVMNEAERMWSEALGDERDYIEQIVRYLENALDSQDPQRAAEARSLVAEKLNELKAQKGRW